MLTLLMMARTQGFVFLKVISLTFIIRPDERYIDRFGRPALKLKLLSALERAS